MLQSSNTVELKALPLLREEVAQWRSLSVHELTGIQAKLASNADATRERLRELVGQRYRSIIESADAIVEMSELTSTLQHTLADILASLDSLVMRKKVSFAVIQNKDSHDHDNIKMGQEQDTAQSLLLELCSSPERSHELLTSKQYEQCALLLERVKLVADQLLKEELEAPSTRLYIEQITDSLPGLAENCKRQSFAQLCDVNAERGALVSALRALQLLQNSSSSLSRVAIFLEARMVRLRGVLRVVESVSARGGAASDRSALIARALTDVTALLILTLTQAHDTFQDDAASATTTASAVKDWFEAASALVKQFAREIFETVHNSAHLANIRDVMIQFLACGGLDTSAAMHAVVATAAASQSDAVKSEGKEEEEVDVSLDLSLNGSVDDRESEELIALSRRKELWIQACNAFLQRRVRLWDELYHDSFAARVKTLIELLFSNMRLSEWFGTKFDAVIATRRKRLGNHKDEHEEKEENKKRETVVVAAATEQDTQGGRNDDAKKLETGDLWSLETSKECADQVPRGGTYTDSLLIAPHASSSSSSSSSSLSDENKTSATSSKQFHWISASQRQLQLADLLYRQECKEELWPEDMLAIASEFEAMLHRALVGIRDHIEVPTLKHVYNLGVVFDDLNKLQTLLQSELRPYVQRTCGASLNAAVKTVSQRIAEVQQQVLFVSGQQEFYGSNGQRRTVSMLQQGLFELNVLHALFMGRFCKTLASRSVNLREVISLSSSSSSSSSAGKGASFIEETLLDAAALGCRVWTRHAAAALCQKFAKQHAAWLKVWPAEDAASTAAHPMSTWSAADDEDLSLKLPVDASAYICETALTLLSQLDSVDGRIQDEQLFAALLTDTSTEILAVLTSSMDALATSPPSTTTTTTTTTATAHEEDNKENTNTSAATATTKPLSENAAIQLLFDIRWLFGALRVESKQKPMLQQLLQRVEAEIDTVTLSVSEKWIDARVRSSLQRGRLLYGRLLHASNPLPVAIDGLVIPAGEPKNITPLADQSVSSLVLASSSSSSSSARIPLFQMSLYPVLHTSASGVSDDLNELDTSIATPQALRRKQKSPQQHQQAPSTTGKRVGQFASTGLEAGQALITSLFRSSSWQMS